MKVRLHVVSNNAYTFFVTMYNSTSYHLQVLKHKSSPALRVEYVLTAVALNSLVGKSLVKINT